MAELLRIEGLRAGYGETVVLEDVALALPERGTLALLGRNGVGKTTLLASLMGHTTLHSGKIDFSGKGIQDRPPHQRSRLGIGYDRCPVIVSALSMERLYLVGALQCQDDTPNHHGDAVCRIKALIRVHRPR